LAEAGGIRHGNADTSARQGGNSSGAAVSQITARTSNKVIDDDRVQGVSFTGSDGSGAQVAERAGGNVKKLILGLGASNPFVVLEDAERRLVAKA